MRNLKVAILVPPHDPAAAADRLDTFVQEQEITKCLRALGNECLTVVFGDDRTHTATALLAWSPDAVVNLVEDLPEGPEHLYLATELLDRLELPHTGAPSAALRALADKREMKRRLHEAGLPVAPGPEDADANARFIVKSAVEHASIGIDADSVVSGRDRVERLIAARQAQYGGAWFAEAYIEGREFNLGILETRSGLVALPIAEILFLDRRPWRPNIVGYEEKWAEGTPAYELTPRRFSTERVDRTLREELVRLGLAAWRLFALRGYARADFRVDEHGNPYILEINANPCLAENAGFCAAAQLGGIDQTGIVAHLIETALA